MISINKKTIGLIALILVILAAGAWAGYSIIHANTPVRIGVLLPVTGDIELKEPLEWAKDNINREGGIGGRPIELVYKDTRNGNVTQLAQELLDDPTIHIVIGPQTSDQVYALAPAFIAREKLLISPETTSGDIIRAFGKKGYFWRTCQGDVAQVKMILSILKGKGAKKVALLTENTTWGDTFYDWTGFFSTEYGLELISIRQFDQGSSSLDNDVADVLKTNPDYIIAICRPPDAATIKRAIDRSGSPAKLFLADASVSPVLTESLGAAAEGLEGTSPTADPSTGFTVAYLEKFGHPPTDYAAPAYDALLLAAYTTARQDASFFESPADSIRKVVYGNGTPLGWDAQESHEALAAIRPVRPRPSPGPAALLTMTRNSGLIHSSRITPTGLLKRVISGRSKRSARQRQESKVQPVNQLHEQGLQQASCPLYLPARIPMCPRSPGKISRRSLSGHRADGKITGTRRMH